MDIRIDLLEELDNISKIHEMDRDDVDAIMKDFARRIVAVLRIDRMNAWLFDTKGNALVSVGEYDSRDQSFKKNTRLESENYPLYFAALKENKILIVPNIHQHLSTKELSDDYARPNDVISLMDIPLRMEGKLIGVMCFETTGKKERHFSPQEQFFAMSVSQVFASNMEARARRAAQHLLDKALYEKELLIQEINHRMKNNFAILISLLKLSRNRGKTQDPVVLLEEYEHRVRSMMQIQELLMQTRNYTEVDLKSYFEGLAEEFQRSDKSLKFDFRFSGDACRVSSGNALHLGLMITEIFLNSSKHALSKNKTGRFVFLVTCKGDGAEIEIGDDLQGFNFGSSGREGSLGLQLIEDIATDLNLKATWPTGQSGIYRFLFSPEK